MTAQCTLCGETFYQGDAILVSSEGHVYHASCFPREDEDPLVPQREEFDVL